MSQEEGSSNSNSSSSSTDDERRVEDGSEGADEEDTDGAGKEESEPNFMEVIVGKVIRELTNAREAFDDYANRDADGQQQQSAVERISPGRLSFFRPKSAESSSDHSKDEESAVVQEASPHVDESMDLSISRHHVSNHTAAVLSLTLEEPNQVSISVCDLFAREDQVLPGAYSVSGPRPEDISTAVESNANLIDDADYNESNHSPTATPADPEAVLATANPVSEIPRAQPEPDDFVASQHKRRKSTEHKRIRDMRAMRTCIVAALLVMVIAVVLSFHLKSHFNDQPAAGRSNNPCHIDPNVGDIPRKDYMLSLLPDYTKEALGVTKDNSPNASSVMTPLPFAMLSPQAKAFNWTINNPNFCSHRYEPWQLKQRFALACFYYATGGETSWKSTENWLSYTINETDWYSNHIPKWIPWHDLLYTYNLFEETSHQLNHLWLVNNSLGGTIPPELTLLTCLRSIDVTGNPMLRGPIPSEIGNLHRLEVLMFSENTMTGELPTELGQLTKLLSLTTDNNTFQGTIPSQLSMLENMTVLDLALSGLEGRIPSELGIIHPLGIWLEGNDLNSTIPTELGLTSAHVLNIHSNMITGTIPSELGNLPHELGSLVTSGFLTGLTINSTCVTGTIPEELCHMGRWNGSSWVGLAFDCSEGLCGCSWCPCLNSPPNTTIIPLQSRCTNKSMTAVPPSSIGAATLSTTTFHILLIGVHFLFYSFK
ncbi:Leucine Rich Repeat [Seminavis robusta]|uniref:Leucine Rich Repeat n=1 Tax=Seminavis robusta TaxID=568900 RepID=A0A9N8EI06_9STRA|nr:Leucine Rich Repeat [Seminavis robusta]|eukprot:Sro1197_g251540.1 Leucine Rich Repeat (712) ;mRNA; f:21950-24463